MDAVRIDKWLWAARFFKTRGASTEAVLGGRVHVNDERVKPAKDVHVGDRLEVTIGDFRRTLVVRGLADKRGPASVAATLYEETPESIARAGAAHGRAPACTTPRRRPRRAPDEAGSPPSRGVAAGAAPRRWLTQSDGSTGRPGRVMLPAGHHQAITSTARRPAWTAGSCSARRRASSSEPTR